MVSNFQRRCPVTASNAASIPRVPNSPPDTPTMTESLTISGAAVIEYPSDDFATSVCQTTFPFSALIATKYPSKLPKKRAPPRIARPRLTLPQQTGRASGSVRVYVQISVPVFASKAMTLAGGAVMNMAPPTTSGVDSDLGLHF